jgi:hypothetical protein
MFAIDCDLPDPGGPIMTKSLPCPAAITDES